MRFKLVETIDKSYERFFHIVKNEAGNYLAMHNDENKANKRILVSGREKTDPFCWSNRKTILVDALNELTKQTPEVLKYKFLDKGVANIYNLHTYDGQELPHKEINENAIGNNNEINKKKYKKHSWSPFMKKDAGDPETNRKAFNDASKVGKVPTSDSGMSGSGDAGASSGGDAGGAGAGA